MYALCILLVYIRSARTCHTHRHVAHKDDGCGTDDGPQHADELVCVRLWSQWAKGVVLIGAAANSSRHATGQCTPTATWRT
jgi:hypothetical protein